MRSPAKTAFRALQKDTAAQYGRTWGLWAVFVIRLYELRMTGDNRYPVHFTIEQERSIQWAQAYCHEKEGHATGERVLLELARAFWRPEDMDDFEHLANDQFNDPTVRFGALINLRPDGTFATPRNATHHLVQIKYFMRAALFRWSRLVRPKQEGQGQDSKDLKYVSMEIIPRLSSGQLNIH